MKMPLEGIEKSYPKLILSIPTFNEIANILDQNGVKTNQRPGSLILEKGTMLVPPVDMRQTTIRRDVLIEAAKVYIGEDGQKGATKVKEFVEFCQTLYEWVYDGKLPKEKTGEWK